MEHSKMIFERRLYKRFQVKEGVYALLKNDTSKLGQIKNISKGGLAFLYINNEAELHGSLEVNIFLSGHGFYFKNIPCKAISDLYIENKVPFSTFKLRQLGIQFKEISSNLSTQLDIFIQNYTLSA